VNLIEHKFRGPVNRYGEGPFTTPGDFCTPNGSISNTPIGSSVRQARRDAGFSGAHLSGLHRHGWGVDCGSAGQRSGECHAGANMWGSGTAASTTWCG
jgi:hypothetical protein